MRIAIIGGSGFVGSRLISLLQTIPDSKLLNIDKQPSKLCPDITEIADVLDVRKLTELLVGIEVVVLLAAEHRDDHRPVGVQPAYLRHDEIAGDRRHRGAEHQRGYDEAEVQIPPGEGVLGERIGAHGRDEDLSRDAHHRDEYRVENIPGKGDGGIAHHDEQVGEVAQRRVQHIKARREQEKLVERLEGIDDGQIQRQRRKCPQQKQHEQDKHIAAQRSVHPGMEPPFHAARTGGSGGRHLLSHLCYQGLHHFIGSHHEDKQHRGNRAGISHLVADGPVILQVIDDGVRLIVGAWKAAQGGNHVAHAEGTGDAHHRREQHLPLHGGQRDEPQLLVPVFDAVHRPRFIQGAVHVLESGHSCGSEISPSENSQELSSPLRSELKI